MGKIIFLDIDGTIRDFDGTIPDSAIMAIRAARAAGHKVCISSARPYCQIDKRVLDIGFDGVVSSAGCYITYEGKCLSHLFFSQSEAEDICRFLIQNGCILELGNRNRTAVLLSQEQAYQSLGDRIQAQLGPHAAKLLSEHEGIEKVSDMAEIEKILYFTQDLSVDRLLNNLGGRVHAVEFHIPNSRERGGEITPIGANKGNGVAAVLRAGGFRQEDVIAVGDSNNDIEMLKLAAIGVAMGNGTEEAKRSADLVTAGLQEDGLAKAFHQLNLS